LRTSVTQLSRYLRCYLNNGVYGRYRLLQERTIREMLSQQEEGDRVQGLTWYAYRRKNGDLAWGHGGSDPGVNTDVRLLPSKGIGAIVFANTNGIRPQEFTERLLREAERI
jgi:CubicO group peptidase (beta-lactamase class C family)